MFISLPGVPERPEELEVTKVTKDLISVTWKPPKSDGGSEITMYILEARMIGKDKYTRLTKEKLLERKYTYDGLREGDSYEFRVIAVNDVGPSKPSFCTKPITCKDELGEPSTSLHVSNITSVFLNTESLFRKFLIIPRNHICGRKNE